MRRISIALVLAIFGRSVYTYSSGAPSTACNSLTPGHEGTTPQSSSSPYTLNVSVFDLYSDGNFYYMPGSIYQLTLSGDTFKGFLLQARLLVDDTTLVGSFSDPDTGTQFSSCSPPNSGLTHTNSSDKVSITGTWTAPSLGVGPIRFRFTVVENFAVYWADIMTDVIYEAGVNILFESSILANNSLIVRGGVGEEEDGLTCTSEYYDCCSSVNTSFGWFSPTGDAVYEGADGATDLYVTRGTGFVRLNRITGGTSALYWCDVPDYTGTVQRYYVGLYTDSILSGDITAVVMSFELETAITVDPPQFSVTGRSEGGPATTVTWERNGVTIQDNGTFSSSQIVTGAVLAVYLNILVVTGRYAGEYKCTVSSERPSFSNTIDLEVATDPVNVVAIQEDLSATSIRVMWSLPSVPTPVGNGFVVFSETDEFSNTVNVDYCTECNVTLSELMTGATYSVYVITQSAHIPSNIIGPVNVTLATGCVDLGYTDGCCIPNTETNCTLDVLSADDYCLCSEECYSLGNCCQDILHSCLPPEDVDLCILYRGYGCADNASCISVGGQVTDSSSYQCVCNEGYIGDSNTTCLDDSVEVNPPVVLATNGSLDLTITCIAPSFTSSTYYWVLVDEESNITMIISSGQVLEIELVVFEDRGDRYQCVLEIQYGSISSDLVEIIVSPEGGVTTEPSMLTVERGEDAVRLMCTSEGGLGNTFTWTKYPSGQQISANSSLVQSVYSGADGGVYMCCVENAAGSDCANATVNVSPVFELSPVSVSAEIESNITLHCSADGLPTPSIEWVHFSAVIREREGVGIAINQETITSTTINSSLVFSGLETQHYGQYACRANGAIDSETATISFTGAFNQDECEEVYVLTEASGTLTVGSIGTVCFQCLYDNSTDPETQWTLESEPISNSTGTTFNGHLAIFAARQVFRVDSPLMLQCMGTLTYTYATTIRDFIPPTVEIESSGDGVAGRTLSLTCSVTEQDSLAFPPLVQFLDGSGDTLNQQNIESTTVGAVTTLVLTFSPLVASAGGQYRCRATVIVPQEAVETIITQGVINVTVTIPQPNVLVVPQNESIAPYAAIEYSVVCKIDLDTMYVDVETEIVVVWMDNEGQQVTNDTRITIADTQTAAGGGYKSTLTFSPLSLIDNRDYTCSVTIVADDPSPFVTASNPTAHTYTINVTAPPEPTLTFSITGSGAAREPLQLQCTSQFIQGLFRPPSVVILNPLGEELDTQQTHAVTDSLVRITSLLDPLLTSDSGVYTCISSYDYPEVGLVDTTLYSTRANITVTVSIPVPQVDFGSVLNETYIGTETCLYCIVELDTAVDTMAQVNISIRRDGVDANTECCQEEPCTSVTEPSSNIFQSNIVFRPLLSENRDNYTCSVTVESASTNILGAAAQKVYSLVPLDTPTPEIDIDAEEPLTLGTDVSLICRVTTVSGLLYPPMLDWQQFPDPSTVIDVQTTNGNVFSRALEFSPLLATNGGLYVCSATLLFPNTSLPSLSNTQNYTLVVKAPVPDVLITHSPIGDLIEGASATLQCTATIPQPNSLVFSIDMHWVNADMTEIVNSSDSRIVISLTAERETNVFVSSLTIAAVSAELDGSFGCVAEIVIQDQGEFVTTQPTTSTISPVIVGPPRQFVAEVITQTSVSFTWNPPLTPGRLIVYVLACQATVEGVADPLPVNTTLQSTVLPSLSPGVPYSCSLTAITDTNMPPPATLTATTRETAPTGPPRNFMVVSASARSITFTWQPPQPHLQNGAILFYSITCDPTPFTSLVPVNESGSATFTGFSPLTSYNCSIRASNNAGTGPLAYDNVTTEDDTTLIQLKVLGIDDCVSWKNEDEDLKLADITSATVDNINKRCDCDFTADSVVGGVYLCFSRSGESVTFRAGLRGLADVSSTSLAAHVTEWVSTGQTVLIQNVHYVIDSRCKEEVVIDDLSRPECATQATGRQSGTLSTGETAGITAGAILLVVLSIGISIVVAVVLKLRRRGYYNVGRNRPHDEGVIPLRENTMRGEMTNNSIYQSSSYVARNPHHETPNPLYSPVGMPPSSSANVEESDGYALPSTVVSKTSELSRRPSDYLKPVSPERRGEAPTQRPSTAVSNPLNQSWPPSGYEEPVSPERRGEAPTQRLLPIDTSTMFTNRLSGIYEDPDYMTIAEVHPAVSGGSGEREREEVRETTLQQ